MFLRFPASASSPFPLLDSLRRHPSPLLRKRARCPPLIAACRRPRRLPRIDVRALSLFLDAGADPNSRQLDSITPLMSAAGVFHLEGVRLLLAAGADINAANSDGFTPLMLACRPYSADRLERSLGRRVEREEHEAMVTATVSTPPPSPFERALPSP